MHLRHGEQVNLNLLASSEYPSHVVELIVLHRPASSTFDNNTGLFKWTALNGEYYVSVRAQLKVVSNVVIDEPNKYKPQPTSHIILLLNVIKDKTPLINPTIIKMEVDIKLIITIFG
ncbi:unnamed protein product [Rotaria sp. Silwood1]|nr:unnamed protein product [Rotaria sp. Silwood1]